MGKLEGSNTMGTRHKTLYLMRHGQTHSNVDGRFQGSDEPLTTKGRMQAMKLGDRLGREYRSHPITTLISSTHVRALETATLVGRAIGLTPVVSPLFVERKHPTLIHGKLTSDPSALTIFLEGRAHFHNPDFIYGDGENFAQLKARAIEGLACILALPDAHIGLVTHGVFATALLAVSQRGEHLSSHDLNTYQFRLENTGLSILAYETRRTFSDVGDGWIVERWGDIAHLA